MTKYLQVRPGLSRRCDHENTTKILEKNYDIIKLCWKCGTFWHLVGKTAHPIEIHSKHALKYVIAYIAPRKF